MNAIQRLFRKRDLQSTLADEIRVHLEEKTQAFLAEGKSEAEARDLAHRAFGNVTLSEELSRDQWGWNAFEHLWSDLRFSIRTLLNTPAFTFTAIAVLALGIGMNTAIFTAVKAVLLSRLPYPEPERLMNLSPTAPGGQPMNASGPDFRDWQTQNRTFVSMATYDTDSVSVSGRFAPRRVNIGVVSQDFFRTVDVEPSIGRPFSEEERKPGGRPAVLMSSDLAAVLFGAARTAINRDVRMDGLSFTIVGVMPPGFDFPHKAKLWISQEAFGDNEARSAHNYHVLGRLKDGVTMRRAQADLDVIAARLAKVYADDKDQGLRVTSLYEELVGPFRPAFVVLLCAVVCVLLIACVNISSLQLVRATTRSREMAVRAALGAAQGRLMRQQLTESILLALAGGAAGMFLAIGGSALFRHYAPAEIPRLENIRVDGEILAFTMVLSLAAGILFGLLPALAASKADVNDALKEGAAKATPGPRLKALSRILVVSEIAIAVGLLSGASLLVRSLWKLDHVDTGLRLDAVFTAALTWSTPDGNSVNAPQVARISSQMITRIQALNGTVAAGLIRPLPVWNAGSNGDFEIQGVRPPSNPHDAPNAWYRAATAGYFKAFCLPILAGRNFTDADNRSSSQVAIVNQSFAKTFLKNGDALGRRIRFLGMELNPQFMTIIGVVPDVRAFGVRKSAEPEVFVDYLQHAGASLDVTLVVQGSPSTQDAIRKIIGELNPDTSVEFESMNSILSSSLSRDYFETALFALFAGFALLLAALGIYGVLSYTVTQRQGELGIRMALGAQPSDVLGLVFHEGLLLAAAGLSPGILCALLCTRALSSLLYEVSPQDPPAFAGMTLIFGGVVLLSCLVPALRAASTDPYLAIRCE